MDRETAIIALQFLQRLNLTGSEAQAFVRVQAALAADAEARAPATAATVTQQPVGVEP